MSTAIRVEPLDEARREEWGTTATYAAVERTVQTGVRVSFLVPATAEELDLPPQDFGARVAQRFGVPLVPCPRWLSWGRVDGGPWEAMDLRIAGQARGGRLSQLRNPVAVAVDGLIWTHAPAGVR